MSLHAYQLTSRDMRNGNVYVPAFNSPALTRQRHMSQLCRANLLSQQLLSKIPALTTPVLTICSASVNHSKPAGATQLMLYLKLDLASDLHKQCAWC
eukprot:1158627-Pelagomonas_calceolata.AAC.4